MDNWDEIRTAFQVARLGTVSGAAEVLGVHHATVIRHIDALEKRLGAKLFQRHARGYTPTEAGRDLLSVAQTTEEQFAQLSSRIKGQGETVRGEFVITSIGGLSDLLVPVLAEYQRRHPEVIIRFLTDNRVFRLDYGEAHVAIRAGNAPDQPDNVVQRLGRNATALFAAPAYLDTHGVPETEDDLRSHVFVGPDDPESRAPAFRWMREHVGREQVVFRSGDGRALKYAVIEGLGLGFLPVWEAACHPELVQVGPAREEWSVPLWLVTHVDLHRTAKVQAFLRHIKDEAAHWI